MFSYKLPPEPEPEPIYSLRKHDNHENFKKMIFQQMDTIQLLHLSFGSIDAAIDIQKAAFAPKLATIRFGSESTANDWVLFTFDDAKCEILTESSVQKLERGRKSRSVYTLNGSFIEQSVDLSNGTLIAVSKGRDFLDVLKIVDLHLSSIFRKPGKMNIKIHSRSADLASYKFDCGKLSSVDRLELFGNWDDAEAFDKFLGEIKYNSLTIRDSPPVNSRIMKINADFVHFNIQNKWLTSGRFTEMNTKEIVLMNGNDFSETLSFANWVMKSWAEGTGLEQLQNMTISNFNENKLPEVAEDLTPRMYNKYRRPGYFCDYYESTGDFSRFHDIRESSDVENLKGQIATLFVANGCFNFVVWNQKNLEHVRKASEKINEKKDRYFEEIEVARRRDAEERAESAEIIMLRQMEFDCIKNSMEQRRHEISGRIAELEATLENEERLVELRNDLREVEEYQCHRRHMFECLRTPNRHWLDEINKIESCIQQLDGYLNIIQEHSV